MALEPKNFLKACTLAARQFLTLGRKTSHTEVLGAQHRSSDDTSFIRRDAIYRLVGASGNHVGYAYSCVCGGLTPAVGLFADEVEQKCCNCGQQTFNIKERAVNDLRAAQLREVDVRCNEGIITVAQALTEKNKILAARITPAEQEEALRSIPVHFTQPQKKMPPFIDVWAKGADEVSYSGSQSEGRDKDDPFAGGVDFCDPFAASFRR